MKDKQFKRILRELCQLRDRTPHQEARRKIEVIDDLLDFGEEQHKMKSEITEAAQVNAVVFFTWLIDRGIEEGSEVLIELAEHFFEHVYLVYRRRHRRPNFATLPKTIIAEYIALVEFAVPERMWRNGINPFDGMILFYRYLEEIGYPGADAAKRERAIKSMRRTIPKQPCQSKQDGYELTQ